MLARDKRLALEKVESERFQRERRGGIDDDEDHPEDAGLSIFEKIKKRKERKALREKEEHDERMKEEETKGPGRVTLMAGYKKDRGTYNPDEDGGIAEGDEEASGSGSGSGSGSPSSVKGGAAESPQQQSSLALVAVGSGAAGVVGLSRMKVQKR